MIRKSRRQEIKRRNDIVEEYRKALEWKEKRRNQDFFIQHIKNGQLLNGMKTINNVYKAIFQAFAEKKDIICIKMLVIYVEPLAEYFNKLTDGMIIIENISHFIHTTVRIHINIDYDVLSDEEYKLIR